MSGDPVERANAILREKGYREPHLAVFATPLPHKALLKGSKILSPFSDSPETVLRAVEGCVPSAEALGTRTITPHELRAWLDEAAG